MNSFRVEDGDSPGLASDAVPTVDISLAEVDGSFKDDWDGAVEFACCLNFDIPVRFLCVGKPVVEDLKVGACGADVPDD